jgi:hypothetical protein
LDQAPAGLVNDLLPHIRFFRIDDAQDVGQLDRDRFGGHVG